MQHHPKTIVAVGAHHDDNEIVAGTLASYKAAGWRAVSVVMTLGLHINGVARPEHNEIRESESLESAKLLGMEAVFLRFREGEFRFPPAARLALLEELRKYQPDIVLTHPPHDYHTDHMETSRCTLEAVRQIGNAAIETNSPPGHQPRLYHSDAWFVPFEPDTYVDISTHMDLKMRMLACHKSQLPEKGPSEHGMQEYARLQSRTRGVEAQVAYAEAFRFVPSLGSVRVGTLLS